jgi:cell division protein ZapA
MLTADMSAAPIEIQIGSRSFRIATTAPAELLKRDARLVSSHLNALPPAQRQHPNALLLVALALAHELEETREAQRQDKTQQVQRARGLLQRVDTALGGVDEHGATLRPAPSR